MAFNMTTSRDVLRETTIDNTSSIMNPLPNLQNGWRPMITNMQQVAPAPNLLQSLVHGVPQITVLFRGLSLAVIFGKKEEISCQICVPFKVLCFELSEISGL
jgi:hypothetical protein